MLQLVKTVSNLARQKLKAELKVGQTSTPTFLLICRLKVSHPSPNI